MRIEATIPDNRGIALAQLAKELGVSKSQVIDEALGVFAKMVLEARQGRRIVTVMPGSDAPACELSTPSLTALEWTRHVERITVTPEEYDRMVELIENPPPPSELLRTETARVRKLAEQMRSRAEPQTETMDLSDFG